jgi:hypothetical protein
MNIVFDFGAVLFNWRPVDLVAEVFPRHAVDTSQAKRLAQEVFGHEDWQNFDRGLLDLDAVTERTSKRLGLDANTLHQGPQAVRSQQALTRSKYPKTKPRRALAPRGFVHAAE